MNIIEIESLSKSFGNLKAVDNLSFSVEKGQLFAFLGVNGAGKSTTIKMMCGQMTPSSGAVKINSVDVSNSKAEALSVVGVVFQNSLLDKSLSVRDNLKSRAALYGVFNDDFENRLKQLSSMLQFSDLLKSRVGKLSGGQIRRIDIARALIHDPEILILDEPTTGLDPITRNLLWSVISDLRRNKGLTVVLTTHYMEEAADADKVVIINAGKKVAEGTPIDLKNSFSKDCITLYTSNESDVKKLGYEYTEFSKGYKIFVPNTKVATDLIISNPTVFSDYEIVKGNMDDVFLNVTGRRLSGGDSK